MNKKSNDDRFNFKKIEEKYQKYWEENKIYKFVQSPKKKTYSIDTPPPTVSGKMHIGHAFSYAQQDFIVRFKRMNQSVFYPFGTDDNGLPTERLIEKIKNVKSKDMSRSDFIDLCLKTLKQITPDFIQDWKDLGISCDYDVSYSTINKNSQKLSQKSFLELYKKGDIYKKDFPTLWCPECQTSIAQAELEDKQVNTLFSTLKFEVNEKTILIATTRPELLGACVAVFVHPDDKRYKEFINKKAKIPLFNYEVQIIADKSAEIEKGTGAMMVCSYGDKYDVDAINKHKLIPKIIFNKDGTMNLEPYKGLSIKQARERILEDLKSKDLISKQEKIHNIVNTHDKCGTPIEFISTEQWFIKILDKKKKLIEQGNKIKWHPEFMHKRYLNWVNGLEWDWSISRDRHFGISIPAWYCSDCEETILASESELPVDPTKTNKICKICKKQAKPESKVLDTWATSSLTPQIASSIVNNKVKIPYSLRPQAHDIIRTWAFYTITKAYLHENKIPWNDIMISGFVKLEGEKMSKSKGNTIAPQEIINEYGADALRFWAAGSKLGEDLDYQEKDLVTGKKFVIKLQNASKFVFMNLNGFNGKKPSKLETIDKLFLGKLNQLIKRTTTAFESYEYSKARQEIERFFWSDFADNYLEIIKKRIYNKKGQKKQSAQYTLYKSLLTTLKLIAPIMPFITEELYQIYFKKIEKEKSIHLSEWPKFKEEKLETKKLDLFYNILGEIRQEKSNNKKPMNSEIILTLEQIKQKELDKTMGDMIDVSGAKQIKTGKFNVEFVED